MFFRDFFLLMPPGKAGTSKRLDIFFGKRIFADVMHRSSKSIALFCLSVPAIIFCFPGCSTSYVRAGKTPDGYRRHDVYPATQFTFEYCGPNNDSGAKNSGASGGVSALLLCSLPADVILDTLLFPADGIAWLCEEE